MALRLFQKLENWLFIIRTKIIMPRGWLLWPKSLWYEDFLLHSLDHDIVIFAEN